MPGRGDNNKTGSSGRGAGNQSNQGSKESASSKKTGSTQHAGGKTAAASKKMKDHSSDRSSSPGKEEE